MKTRFKNIMSHIPLISNKTKLLISVSLVAIALIAFCIYPERLDTQICLLAMFFSFLGDLSLNSMPLNKRPHWLLYIGASFFMVAHLQYAVAYYWLIFEGNKVFFNPGANIAITFMILLFAVSVAFAIIFKSKPKLMTIIIFCLYTFVIGINFVTIYSYSWSFASASFVGALSFLISDFIIGIETVFKVKNETLRKLVWVFYPFGQILIIVCR